MNNFIRWISPSGWLGWIVLSMMDTNAQQRTLLNIVISSGGALVVGGVLTQFVTHAPISQHNFNIQTMAIALLGAVILRAVRQFPAARHAVRQD